MHRHPPHTPTCTQAAHQLARWAAGCCSTHCATPGSMVQSTGVRVQAVVGHTVPHLAWQTMLRAQGAECRPPKLRVWGSGHKRQGYMDWSPEVWVPSPEVWVPGPEVWVQCQGHQGSVSGASGFSVRGIRVQCQGHQNSGQASEKTLGRLVINQESDIA